LPDHPYKALAVYDCFNRVCSIILPPGTGKGCFHVLLDEYCRLVVLVQDVPVSDFVDEIGFIFNHELFVVREGLVLLTDIKVGASL
jgi:hypothetical protein